MSSSAARQVRILLHARTVEHTHTYICKQVRKHIGRSIDTKVPRQRYHAPCFQIFRYNVFDIIFSKIKDHQKRYVAPCSRIFRYNIFNITFRDHISRYVCLSKEGYHAPCSQIFRRCHTGDESPFLRLDRLQSTADHSSATHTTIFHTHIHRPHTHPSTTHTHIHESHTHLPATHLSATCYCKSVQYFV